MTISQICFNLFGKYKTANFMVTGTYSSRAAIEARKNGKVNIVYDSSSSDYTRLADSGSWSVEQNADFFFYVENESMNGFENNNFAFERVPAGQPVVCDMATSFLTRPIDWTKFGVVYAGAYKQCGASPSCNITVVRRDLIGRHAKETPSMLAWDSYMNAPDGLPNTPNTWAIYITGLTVNLMIKQGGLGEMKARSKARSSLLYEYIDASGGFY